MRNKVYQIWDEDAKKFITVSAKQYYRYKNGLIPPFEEIRVEDVVQLRPNSMGRWAEPKQQAEQRA